MPHYKKNSSPAPGTLIHKNAKFLLKMPVLNLRKIWSSTALFKVGLANSDIRQLPRPKVKFKDDFLNMFDFTLPLFKALTQDWYIINLYNIRVIFASGCL